MMELEPKPVRRSGKPAYPTKLQVFADPKLLEEHVPLAWLSRKDVAGALALLIAAGSAGCIANTACVAVTPPVYLSEEEALAVIRDGLNGYGIELQPGKTEIPAVTIDWAEQKPAQRKGEEVIGPVKADLEDPDRKVVVEFVSAGDYRELTAQQPDGGRGGNELRMIAETMNAQVRHEKAGEFYFGAMYDPAMWLPSRDTEEKRRDRTKKYLRVQVAEFAEWLKAQGAI